MIEDHQFEKEINLVYKNLVKENNLQNQQSSIKYYIDLIPDFENDKLEITMKFSHKYNIIKIAWYKYKGLVEYII